MPHAVADQAVFDLLESESARYHVGNRTASTALLAWFLDNVWRLDEEEASDAICDGGGDKGIDALHVDEDLKEITVFQAEHRTQAHLTQGDAKIRTFVGVAGYFESEAAIDALIAAHPNAELLRLLGRHNIKAKVAAGHYTVRLIYVTNARLDAAGTGYIATRADLEPALDVWDRERLAGVAERTKSLSVPDGNVELPLASDPIVEELDGSTRMAVALVEAPELVRLPGIDNLSIFQLNVRLGLGRTRINQALASTIRTEQEHALFPAYHNGLTLLTHEIDTSNDGVM